MLVAARTLREASNGKLLRQQQQQRPTAEGDLAQGRRLLVEAAPSLAKGAGEAKEEDVLLNTVAQRTITARYLQGVPLDMGGKKGAQLCERRSPGLLLLSTLF